MFFLFCSKTDSDAIWLYNQLLCCKKVDMEMLYAEDLYDCKDWYLRLSDKLDFAEVTLPNGRVINTKNVTFFLNRVSRLVHPSRDNKDIIKQQYFQQEWNAFLLGWLKAFEPVLVNKLSPASFSGFSGTPLSWSLTAYKAGFHIKPQSYLSDERGIAALFVSRVSQRAQHLLVYGQKVFCNITLAHLSKPCLQLADRCHCNLLEVFVERKSNGEYKFVSATSLPTFSKYSQGFLKAFAFSVMKAQNLFQDKRYRNQLVETL